jgi:hypothetical protein
VWSVKERTTLRRIASGLLAGKAPATPGPGPAQGVKLADLPGNIDIPRVIALIDVPDLQWQMKLTGGAIGPDLTALLERLEAGVAKLDPAPEARLRLGAVHLYSPLEADRPDVAERVVFRLRATKAERECSGCYAACTHCKRGAKDPGGKGRDNPIAHDLLELARADEYDWAVVVSADLLLIPVVRYLQSHGRKIIHGCCSPVAKDLTKECWAAIDLCLLA